MVKKVEESVVCRSANLQTGNQTIIPTDLKTVKYSTEQQIFNSYGEEVGIFSGIKNNLKTTAHIQPYYYSKNIFTAVYSGITSAVLTKFTDVGLPERFKSPA